MSDFHNRLRSVLAQMSNIDYYTPEKDGFLGAVGFNKKNEKCTVFIEKNADGILNVVLKKEKEKENVIDEDGISIEDKSESIEIV